MRLPRIAPLIPYEEAVANIDPSRLPSVDGRRIHVREEGTGPPLVMLHGIAASSYSFRDVIPELARGRRVVAIDLDGHGYTERPRAPNAYRIENQAETIVRVLDVLGIGSAAILGHSYGGAVAAVAAEARPERFSRVVLVCPASRSDRPPWYVRTWPGRQIAYWAVRALLSDPERFRRLSLQSFHRESVFPDEVAEVYRNMMRIEGLRSALAGFAAAVGESGFPEVPFDSLRQPTLVVTAEKDAVVPPASCRELAGRIPDAELVEAPECGHSVAEERPGEFVAIVNRFLDSSR